MDQPFMFADEFRSYLAEQLADIGRAILDMKNVVKAQPVNVLMPDWKEQKFHAEMCNAAGSILRVMSCLESNESPTVDALVEELIQRWRKTLTPDKKKLVVDKLRDAFTNKTTEPKQ